jgi:hypothetical protein
MIVLCLLTFKQYGIQNLETAMTLIATKSKTEEPYRLNFALHFHILKESLS